MAAGGFPGAPYRVYYLAGIGEDVTIGLGRFDQFGCEGLGPSTSSVNDLHRRDQPKLFTRWRCQLGTPTRRRGRRLTRGRFVVTGAGALEHRLGDRTGVPAPNLSEPGTPVRSAPWNRSGSPPPAPLIMGKRATFADAGRPFAQDFEL